jgi:hypothetical protein
MRGSEASTQLFAGRADSAIRPSRRVSGWRKIRSSLNPELP